ncbi:SCP domain-containing protein [Meloidogyne graminicola]|uniref:SCP domain-containing protein n=1 Tax=Meloidogyne graminicola TaxID=189291 RepID=A0A8S9ZE15_9BILA|nr:SCP domain-containing protein [Meloidogyne graminicola]KAF7629972.1 SCP domain-containing protein [Meloidogyne graminicola]
MSSDPNLSITNALTQACENWWAECRQKGVQQSLIFDRNEFAKGIGHCTQMAWATTTKIGCAVQRCPRSQWKTYVVCQYSPPGNFIGQPIYNKGRPCSGCNSGCSNNLCL